jgi:3-hydroxyacyl-CoA dehydrogenase/enoyl-CoA hydratase/3-hydroxybutyryl-CoA epimerase
LTAILTGKIHAAKPAKKVGIVDKIVHKENLESAAVAIVRGKTPPKRCRSVLEYVPSTLVFSKAKKNVLKKTKGNYPAPLKIIEVMKECDSLSVRDSLRLEAQAFLELAQTDECKSLLRIFFLQEKSKKTTVKEWVATRDWSLPISVNNAVVVGAGTMGAGIAQWLTSRGVNVLLKDVNSDAVSAGLQTVGDLYVDGVRGHKFDRPTARNGLARITATTTDVPLHSKDILIEAIVEKLDVKQKVLAQLEEKLSNDAIIATNTSALSIDEMAKCLKRPERFIGIHFFNPVHKMKLVEIVKGSKTSDETVYRAIKFVQQIGKFPVVVNDGPGFVVNRILVPYLVKAAELLGQGTQMEAIDSAMVKFGMPMGPFRLMDEIGLDVCYHVARDLETRLNITCYLEEIKWRVDCKRLGKKSGHGFYYYSKGKCLREKITDTVDISPLIDCMTSEARKILDEGIIDDPDMLDFAMIMGTGWAPFRGGPIYYDQLKPTATVARSQPASSS